MNQGELRIVVICFIVQIKIFYAISDFKLLEYIRNVMFETV